MFRYGVGKMKKIFGILIGFILIILVLLFFARDFILKEYLERKMTEANRAPVKIGSLDLNYLDSYIILKDVEIASNLHKDENFIYISEVKGYYSIDFDKKIVTFDDSEVNGIKFFKEDKYEYNDDEKAKVFQNRVTEAEEKLKREKVLTELKELYLNKIEKNHLNVKEVLEKNLKTKKIEEEIELDKIKESIKNIKESDEKKLKISDVIDEISSIGKSSKKIVKNLNINDLTKPEGKVEELDGVVRGFLDKNKLVLFDLDGYINMYLNLIYEQKIYNLSLKYRDILEEIRLRKIEDSKVADEDKWELFFDSISVSSNVYGINFNGEVKNFSTRLSKDKNNTEFKLFGEKGDTIGEFKGFINFDKEITETNLNIPEANLQDLGNENLESGEAMLTQFLTTNRNYLAINGSINLKNMKLNTEKIVETMKIEDDITKELLVSILEELNRGSVSYSYDTETRVLAIKTDIMEVLDSIINGENSSLKNKMQDKIKDKILEKF